FVRTATTTFLSCAGTFAGKAAARPIAATDACATSRSAQSAVEAAGGRQSQRSGSAIAWNAHLGAGLARHNDAGFRADAPALGRRDDGADIQRPAKAGASVSPPMTQIGRASCRE